MKEFVALTRWIRRYFIDDGHAEKKATVSTTHKTN